VRKKILDVGSGSGYQTAVLCEMAGEVFAVERIPDLAERSRAVLEKLGYDNVTVITGDGTLGLPEQAPFDGIVVAAATPEAPRPLLKQLAEGGRLVVPLGPVHREQMLTVFTREGTGFRRDEHVYCRFVPLIGGEGLGGPERDEAM
jgi:protein-L-isoaspartate(D-aspartate) O-methyltransferase